MPILARHSRIINYEYIPSNTENAETILLIHGLGLDMSTWCKVNHLLSGQYNILQFDFLGHGGSNHGSEEITWDLLSKDILELCIELHIDKVHIVGHGFGGNIGVKFAVNHPAMVQSLTLESTPCYYPYSTIQKITQYKKRVAKGNELDQFRKKIVDLVCYQPTQEIKELLLTAIQKADIEAYFQLLELLPKWFSLAELGQISISTLIVTGKDNSFFPSSVFGLSVNAFRNSALLIVPKASHCVHLDQPEIYSQLVLEHILTSNQTRDIKNWNPLSINLYQEGQAKVRQIIKEGMKRMENRPSLRVNLLHTFRVYMNDEEIVENWNRRHAKELFIYLLLHPTVTREQLYEEFWKDLELTKAQNNLRVSLNHLKKLLNRGENDAFIISDREHIMLTGSIQCDLVELQQSLEQACREKDPEHKLSLAKSVLGSVPSNLLYGLYEDWIVQYRNQLEDRVVTLCLWVVDYLQSIEKKHEAKKYLKIIFQYDEMKYQEALQGLSD